MPRSSRPSLRRIRRATAASIFRSRIGLRSSRRRRAASRCASPRSISFRTIKARSVGDIVTVHVVESVTGSESRDQPGHKRLDQCRPAESLFGHRMAEQTIRCSNLGSLVNSSSDNSTTGTGDMTAHDTFAATVSAVVVAVNPSGTLTIKANAASSSTAKTTRFVSPAWCVPKISIPTTGTVDPGRRFAT